MAFKQKVSISLLIIMVITAPFVHSSRKLHFLFKIFLLKPKKKRALFSPSFNNLSMSAGSYGGIEPARDTSMPTQVMNQNKKTKKASFSHFSPSLEDKFSLLKPCFVLLVCWFELRWYLWKVWGLMAIINSQLGKCQQDQTLYTTMAAQPGLEDDDGWWSFVAGGWCCPSLLTIF